jgi:nucleotide-binding universal stress UspA family protein
MKPFKQILVATDFSDCSRAAIDVAASIASKLEAELTLLHVWEIPVYPYMEFVLNSTELVNDVERAAANRLDQELRQLKATLPRSRSLLRMGIPWQQIVDASKALPAELIVLGTHGRRGIDHLLLGSVAEKVVRLSEVPVLTVHEPRTR